MQIILGDQKPTKLLCVVHPFYYTFTYCNYKSVKPTSEYINYVNTLTEYIYSKLSDEQYYILFFYPIDKLNGVFHRVSTSDEAKVFIESYEKLVNQVITREVGNVGIVPACNFNDKELIRFARGLELLIGSDIEEIEYCGEYESACVEEIEFLFNNLFNADNNKVVTMQSELVFDFD